MIDLINGCSHDLRGRAHRGTLLIHHVHDPGRRWHTGTLRCRILALRGLHRLIVQGVLLLLGVHTDTALQDDTFIARLISRAQA